MADCLVIGAGLAQTAGDVPRAAGPLAAAGRILEEFDLLHRVADPAAYHDYTRRLAEVQAQLEPAAFASASNAGRAWSPAESNEQVLRLPTD